VEGSPAGIAGATEDDKGAGRREGDIDCLLGLAEEILISDIPWFTWMCCLIFEVFGASKVHLGI
jgi:hypothetical protein